MSMVNLLRVSTWDSPFKLLWGFGIGTLMCNKLESFARADTQLNSVLLAIVLSMRVYQGQTL